MESILTELLNAIEARAWYPAIGLGITIVIALWRVIQPKVWDKIPAKYKPVPALILSALTAFVTAFFSGQPWKVALGIAIYTLLSTGPTALGTADMYLRLFNKEVEKLKSGDSSEEV